MALIISDEVTAAGKEGQRWEYVDGEVVFLTPVFQAHGKTNVKKVIGKVVS